METGTKREALTDTDYDSNYDEIFENNGPELDGQTLLIDELDTQLDSKSSSEIDYGDGINELFQDDGLLNGIFSHQLNNTLSIVNFDILRSSLASSPSGQDHFFLTSVMNWELASIREISTKIKKVESMNQVINIHFKLKARPWQIGAIMIITKWKRDVCAIADINVSKNLVYWSISVVINGSVLVISPTIALMEDQICIAPKILNYYYLHLAV